MADKIKEKALLAVKATIITFPIFLLLAIIWFFSVWRSMTVNEFLYHVFSSLEGTGGSVILSFCTNCLIPAVIVWVAAFALLYALRNKKVWIVCLNLMALILLLCDVGWFL